MNYYSFDVNYNNCPDTFTYYFRATSEDEVAEATGIDVEYITKCSKKEIQRAAKAGKHIDTVIHGRLVEVV